MSAPTIDEVTDDILNNADFEESNSTAKAKTFVTAVRRFLFLSPQSQSDQSSTLAFDVAQLRQEMQRAQQFIDYRTRANSSVRFLSTSQGFRR